MTKPFTPSQATVDLIVEFEVAGQAAYERLYHRPTWPEGASGITIGIGYDLGYNTKSQFKADWGTLLSEAVIAKLTPVCGLKGEDAHRVLGSVRPGVSVPWDAAVSVFKNHTLPRFWAETLHAFPGADKLPADCQGALLSLVYNRGASLTGNRRREMREIHEAIAQGTAGALAEIPSYFRAMVRIWRGTAIEAGMRRRREAEAKLFQAGLRTLAHPTVAAPVRVAHPLTVALLENVLTGEDVYREEDGDTYIWARAVASEFQWTLVQIEHNNTGSGKDLAISGVPVSALAVFTDKTGEEFALSLLLVPLPSGSTRGYLATRSVAETAGLPLVWDKDTTTVKIG